IIPPRMRTRSTGRPTAESLGGGTGVRASRGGRGRRPREGSDKRVDELNGQENDQGLGANGGNLLPAMLAQVSNRGNVGNQNGNVVNENCSVENVSKCDSEWQTDSHEMQKLESELWNHTMVRAGHAAYTDRFHELDRLVLHLPKTIQKDVKISGALTDEVMRNGSIKKVEKKGNVGEPSKDKNGRDDNKRSRIGNIFATTVNPVGRENTGTWPKCTICNSFHAPGGLCRTCYNCNCPGHLARDCRSDPRNVNPVNARNPTVRACYECGQ
ncbi:putative reverse transcriptase domain-containing protein, partial [Tanacetum coccineum]